jgi:DNA-directed RNA polymerase subunit RPC12/RpoP
MTTQKFIITTGTIIKVRNKLLNDGYINALVFEDIVQLLHSCPVNNNPCIWTENEDGAYVTTCGNTYEIINGTPRENHMNFCPYCGKRLRVKEND